MRDESNCFQLTVCMMARGVIYARQTLWSNRCSIFFNHSDARNLPGGRSSGSDSLRDFAIIWRNPLTKAGNRLSNPRAVGGIGLGAIGDVPLLNVLGGCTDLAGRILEQRLALNSVHLAEEIAWLLIVVLIDPMIPMGGRAVDPQWRLVELRLVDPFAQTDGEIVPPSSDIAVRAHRPVAVIAVERTLGRVDGDMVKVAPETIALG